MDFSQKEQLSQSNETTEAPMTEDTVDQEPEKSLSPEPTAENADIQTSFQESESIETDEESILKESEQTEEIQEDSAPLSEENDAACDADAVENISQKDTEKPFENDRETSSEATDPVEESVPAESSVPAVKEKRNGKGIVLNPFQLAICITLAIVIAAGAFFLGMRMNHRNTDPALEPNVKDYDDIYVGAADVEAGNLSAPGYSSITFPANRETVQIILPNPKGNPCYFRFFLVLKESGEVLYRSGLVPPGKAITEITLSRPLAAGSYTLEIQIETASLDDRSAMNGINMEVDLTVR